MKLLAALLLIGATSAPVLAGPATGYKSKGGFAREEKCFKTEYREEYVPGTAKNPGYVKSFKKKVRVPCQPKIRYVPAPEPHIHSDPHPNVGKVDDNSCIEGSILGGIAGGGLGAALSRKEGRLWAVPTGIVGGALIGCQMDGG